MSENCLLRADLSHSLRLEYSTTRAWRAGSSCKRISSIIFGYTLSPCQILPGAEFRGRGIRILRILGT
jgi:hypothetical protein